MRLIKILSGIMLIIMSAVMIFHILIFSGVIPYSMVWGGKLTSISQMQIYEAISILINSLMMLIILLRAGILRWRVKAFPIKLALWIMAFLFLLNTLGNLMSENALERSIFTPLTFILAILCIILAINKTTPGIR